MSVRNIHDAWLAMLKQLSSWSWMDMFFSPQDGQTRTIGPELDDLEFNQAVPEHPIRMAVLGELKKIKPVQTVAVLAVVRNEAQSLIEWVAHYRAIGADHLFIYTNDNDDGTEDVLKWLAKTRRVTPLFTSAAKGVNVQFKNYEHALTLLPELRLFKWVIVIDADEFLVPAAKYDYHLPSLLAGADESIDAIVFPWRWRLWERRFEQTPGLLWQRYTHAVGSDHFKSAVKLGNALSLRELHWPTLKPGSIIVDSAFSAISNTIPYTKYHNQSHEGGWIDHYWGRSFEEFVRKKFRGDSAEVEGGHWRRRFDDYFQWTITCNNTNYLPIPANLADRIESEILRLQSYHGYDKIENLIERYRRYHSDKIRADGELRQTFEQLLKRYPIP